MLSARERRFLIGVLSAGNFIVGMGAFVVIGILVPLAADFGVSDAEAGMVMTVYALSYAVLSPLLVALTGAFGRRRVLLFSLTLFALAALLSALSPSIEVLFAARVLAAAGAGVFTPTCAAVVAATSPDEGRGKALAQVFFGLTLAQVLGVPMGSFIAYQIGWQASLGVVVLLALPCIWGISRYVPRGLKFQPTSLAALGGVLADWRVMLQVLFTASFLGSIYVIFTYLAPLLTQTMGYGRNGITLVLVIAGLGAVAGNLVGGWLGDRIGPVRTLFLLTAGQCVLLPLFSLLPMANGLVLALAFAWSVTGWSFMAPQQMRLLTASPDGQAVVLALNAAAIYIGAALGSAYGGVVIEAFGIGMLGISAGLFAAFALVHLWAGTRVGRSG